MLHPDLVPRVAALFRAVPAAIALALLASCGGGAGSLPQAPRNFDVAFEIVHTPHAALATLLLEQPEPIQRVEFSILTKPGNRAADAHVTYHESYLNRVGAVDAAGGRVQFTVFGLYNQFVNSVQVTVVFPDGDSVARTFAVSTVDPVGAPAAPALTVTSADPQLATSYVVLSRFSGPQVVDIDGEVRWVAPQLGEAALAQACTPEGIIVGGLQTNGIYQLDWLGRVQVRAMSDARCLTSHHCLQRGKVGWLNAVAYIDFEAGKHYPESVLAEMTSEGEILRLWDFNAILAGTIQAQGEDPTPLVKNYEDWFHMNSAVYDPTDDSILVSSRENFVIKIDYETGAIKWLLGNPAKLWYTGFPLSLQPLALTVTGDTPIGQHTLSVSHGGTVLTLFNNGYGNQNLPDVGDTRMPSTVSVYQIDEQARTAVEVLSLGGSAGVYSPICSSAYRTTSQDVLALFSSPSDDSAPRLLVLNDADEILFDATIAGEGCRDGYLAEELPLHAFEVR